MSSLSKVWPALVLGLAAMSMPAWATHVQVGIEALDPAGTPPVVSFYGPLGGSASTAIGRADITGQVAKGSMVSPALGKFAYVLEGPGGAINDLVLLEVTDPGDPFNYLDFEIDYFVGASIPGIPAGFASLLISKTPENAIGGTSLPETGSCQGFAGYFDLPSTNTRACSDGFHILVKSPTSAVSEPPMLPLLAALALGGIVFTRRRARVARTAVSSA